MARFRLVSSVGADAVGVLSMCNALKVPVDLVDCIIPRLNDGGAVGVCSSLCPVFALCSERGAGFPTS